MKIPYYHVDAFTSRMFAGNPAGVCPLQGWLSDETMQKIALENRHAETAFFIPLKGQPEHFHLRWFTPGAEVDLCGHATLATAFVLREYLGFKEPVVHFQTLSGLLSVELQGDLLVMDFPSRPPQPYDAPPALVEGLGIAPLEVSRARDILAVFETEAQVAYLKPDFNRLAELDALGVIATAPSDQADFVSRFFAPRVGVPEDPVTGSSHCTLIPYWAKRLGKHKLNARQISARGGELVCTLLEDRVKIGGKAVLYLQGTIEL
jgi:PhzF family phenazine biosynthesis protein